MRRNPPFLSPSHLFCSANFSRPEKIQIFSNMFSHSTTSRLFGRLILIRTTPICSSSPAPTLLCPRQSPFVRWVSSDEVQSSSGDGGSGRSVAVEFLVNSCGFSPDSAAALSVAKKLSFKSPVRPLAVVRLLQEEGFSNAQISEFVRKRPLLLLWNAEKILKPKIVFYKGLGIPSCELSRMISKAPDLLERSLKNHLIPMVDFLRTIVGDSGLVPALRRCPFFLTTAYWKVMVSNIEILRGHGVPAQSVATLISRSPRSLLYLSQEFKETVDKVVDMGFSPFLCAFVLALEALISKRKWEEKLQVYRSLGWSDEQINLAFKKQPMIFRMSVKKIKKMMSFLVGKMGYGPSVVSKCPNLMLLSLEKRIMPRHIVLEVLREKGLLKYDGNPYYAMHINGTNFLARFVAKYQHEVPELLKLYPVK